LGAELLVLAFLGLGAWARVRGSSCGGGAGPGSGCSSGRGVQDLLLLLVGDCLGGGLLGGEGHCRCGARLLLLLQGGSHGSREVGRDSGSHGGGVAAMCPDASNACCVRLRRSRQREARGAVAGRVRGCGQGWAFTCCLQMATGVLRLVHEVGQQAAHVGCRQRQMHAAEHAHPSTIAAAEAAYRVSRTASVRRGRAWPGLACNI